MDGGVSAEGVRAFAEIIWVRFWDLLLAPVQEPAMLWFAIPLVIATVMMALYFGRYRKEDLGWSSAFENAMIFLFISIDILRQMYESAFPHAWVNVFGNPLYFTIAAWLGVVSIISMVFLYYHLFPKKLAFFIYSRTPISISLYVLMAIVYADLPADWATVGAGILLFFVVFIPLRTVQFFQALAGERMSEAEEEGRRKIIEERLDEERKAEKFKFKKKV